MTLAPIIRIADNVVALRPRDVAMDWPSTARDFGRYLRTAGKAEGTCRTYVYNVAFFAQWCARHECSPQDADREYVRAWLSERLQTVTSARAHNDLAALKQFYRWLIEDRYREDDPTRNLRVKRRKSLPTEPLDGSELTALVEACTGERDRLMLLVLAYSGIRISELASLTAERIDWRNGEIVVLGKGDKERRIAPNAEIMNRLHAFCGMFPAGPIFLSQQMQRPLSAQQIRKIIYEVAERAKINGVHPHRFRSFFATAFVEQYGDIQALQGVLGHESIETSARYSEYTRERRAREMMRGLKLGGVA